MYINSLVKDFGNVRMAVQPAIFSSAANGIQRIEDLIATYSLFTIMLPQTLEEITFYSINELFANGMSESAVSILKFYRNRDCI